MPSHQAMSRRTAIAAGVAAAAAASAASSTPAAASTPLSAPADAGREHGRPENPTLVLVHGAFADASSWSPVIERLQRRGHTVIAPANPLRGLRHDADRIAAVLASIEGPVVLAGHSYGGAVITEAAAQAPNVQALVYIAAFVPDKGEVLGELSARFPGSQLAPSLRQVPSPAPDGSPGLDLYIRTDKFHEVFAHDVPHATARTLAAVQRPLSATAFGDQTTAAAWRTVPSWNLVATQDRGIPPQLQRFQAKRADSYTVEIRTSHLPLYSAPDAVANVIRAATRHVTR
ncbi:alpha/beta fold hydrolase [Streptomyces sp. YS415]|uniref:alpha/beta fold hydrolase n=1 Tax=Streptomyces sp. YS415 TaxID=2944806 RepID=UPI002022299B|nr:alpha/beta hydrolase [Streptomyces sp. YS415]MCL7429150.1 alpha/beta hydrolase [Streptomyces sp. YS415]